MKGQQSESVGLRKASTVSGGGAARHSGTTPQSATRPPHSVVSLPFDAVAPSMYRVSMSLASATVTDCFTIGTLRLDCELSWNQSRSR